MCTFDVGEYVTEGGYEAVVKFIIPSPNCDGYNRVGYVKLDHNMYALNTWTKTGISEKQSGEKFDLQVPRRIQWKVICVANDTCVTYGPYSTDSLNSMFRDNIFKLCEQVEVIQCIELNPGERLLGDQIVKVKPTECQLV